MFEFEKRDEGFLVRDKDGRGIASVQTCDLSKKDVIVDKQVHTVDEATPRAKVDWEIHFAGRKMRPADVAQLLGEIDAQG